MRYLVGGLVMLVIGLAAVEVAMQPSAADRLGVFLIFAIMVAGSTLAGWLMPRLARRVQTVRMTLVVLSALSLVIVTAGLVFAGQQMFISSHDFRLLMISLGFGLAVGIGFAVLVSRPLSDDLTRIAATSSRIAAGDRRARTGVTRTDEVGQLASAVDEMAQTLAQADRDKERVEQARREFFAAVGHDLKTPLASLRAALEAVQDGLAEDPDRFFDSMAKDVDALSSLVDDLFLLARIESGEVVVDGESVDLTEIADETIEILHPIAVRRGVALRLDATGRVVAEAGSEATARVLRNLVDNAIRHSPPGGEVVVTVSNGTSAEVLVSDEGTGFAPGFVESAFQRFSRDDGARSRATGGAGLGLAIARGYVEACGGEIWARPGPGGIVGFRLPLSS